MSGLRRTKSSVALLVLALTLAALPAAAEDHDPLLILANRPSREVAADRIR